MTQHSFKVYTCDRCGYVEEIKRHLQDDEWGWIVANQVNGPFRIGGDIKGKKDLCPKCVKELKEWWRISENVSL